MNLENNYFSIADQEKSSKCFSKNKQLLLEDRRELEVPVT